jgi:hypothetical protein
MTNGLGRLFGLPILWAFVWAIPAFGIEALSNLGVQIGSGVDMWPQTLAIPGLVAGVVFSVLVAAAGRWRTFETSSLAFLLGLGAVVGLAMAGIVATGAVGGEETAGTYVFVLVMSVVSAVVSAAGFRLLARKRARARAEA